MEAAAAYDRWSLLEPDSIDYGFFSNHEPVATSLGHSEKGFYITTAINYTNGPAHMGHAYEAATSDAIARYARLKRGVAEPMAYFVTGADEHGEKIAKTAEKEGKDPMDICHLYVTGFQCLNQRILVSNNDYIRTTSLRHKRTAQALWLRCASNNDIYLDQYTGWYNVKEEAFVTDSEAELCNYCDVSTGQPLQRVQEASYFFKMSNYHDRLMEHIQLHPEFIQPESHRNAILARLNTEKLRDLSVSRTTFTHGIPVPEGFESNHVMYVWFDALTNYLTGVDAMGVCQEEGARNDMELAKLWPADVHIIGKDILWFHTVIWPCILMSAKMPLPKTVFAHGFVNDRDGKKMSKSVGNVVDPHDMLDRFDVDSFRWYLCKEAPFGGELSFSEDSMRDMHNADLCDTLGNLVHRVTMLCVKYCNGVIPPVSGPETCVLDFQEIRKAFVSKMDTFALEGGASIAIQACRDINGYLTREEPWKLKGDEYMEKRQIVVRATLEALYAVTHMLIPFIPKGASQILKKMNTPPKALWEIDANLRNLAAGTKIDVGDILYERNLSEEEKMMSKEDSSKMKQYSYEEAQRLKKEKKAKEIALSKAGQANAEDDQPEFTKIDIRVGKITKVWNHPEAEKLFCEEIDVGENSGPRQIASGLREHYSLDELQDKKVLVVCNLKPAKMLGFTSDGMVLAAKSADGQKVELLHPPLEAPIGERVFIDGMSGEPYSSTQVKKKKTWETVAKSLQTNDKGVATWDGKEIKTSAGVCSAKSLASANIS